MTKLIMYWFPVILWMVLIFSVSSIPNLSPGFSDGANTLISKLAHIIEYAVLAFLLVRALEGSQTSLSFQSLLQLAFLLALLYAISDEYHQLFVIGREGTFRDVMIDAIGITLVPLWLTKQKRGR